ncbi:DUF4160 domain-containing protein [Clostridium botulinum]|uniref:DUF4160 domain-containing protein n=1 Tax=Clostridium botulinum TaxID=1491 RepID=A0A6B4JR87_CLOBO|nr:DUF4160 domain-containing protein [Clostridium botulinum]EES47756.1 conserved hypothetical protein [Clostridium botulinum E1 str. 'BoNT E Beluga']MBY6762679.1 DUF4160 domain-containing protein [Clostridium botulinum]MBY6921464.1 DUF4160 domain-containing protein [Clostridium botulinum]MCR1132305.1 DUF4160 domain-containing protein [Clostridium botulinum]NFJ59350.1 DUF4160 domain-containing protein [Clostridium botulinum]
MPVITRFYGIIVKMYPNDYTPPHFHAIYGEYVGVIDINTLEMIEGDLSNRALKLVKEWAEKYQNDLMHMWNSKEFRKLQGLE